MGKTLVFATNNAHKLEEVRAMLPEGIGVVSLKDVNFGDDIEETASTLEGNAKIKAETISRATGKDCLADDTGLEVEALGGRPGVRSARYAGEGHDDAANREKLLAEMKDEVNRKARFRTVVALIWEGETRFFEGIVNGTIATAERGTGGFGYDALFVPEGYDKTFAELPAAVKNSISHRARAVEQMVKFLKKQNND